MLEFFAQPQMILKIYFKWDSATSFCIITYKGQCLKIDGDVVAQWWGCGSSIGDVVAYWIECQAVACSSRVRSQPGSISASPILETISWEENQG